MDKQSAIGNNVNSDKREKYIFIVSIIAIGFFVHNYKLYYLMLTQSPIIFKATLFLFFTNITSIVMSWFLYGLYAKAYLTDRPTDFYVNALDVFNHWVTPLSFFSAVLFLEFLIVGV